MQDQVLDVSWKTIGKVFIAGFFLYVFYLARDIALWFFFALIISVLLEPAINFLRWLRIPKILAIVLIYVSIFGFVGLLIYITAPIFVFELKQFSQNIPEYFEKINPFLKQFGIEVAQGFDNFTSLLIGGLEQSSKGIMSAVASFFGGIASAFFILALAFFLSMEEKGVERVLVFIMPQRYEERIITIFKRVQKKVSGWFGARILSCLFVGVASFIVFYIFGIKYAFLLALVSGIMNFIPYIGPWVTAVLLVVFIAVSSSSWVTALYVLISVTVIQAVENSILTPLLMKKMIDLPPVLVLISILVGSQVFGFLGAVFAVPVFGIVYESLREFLERRRTENIQLD